MADLYYRSGQYEKGLEMINPSLQLNTYDPESNLLRETYIERLETILMLKNHMAGLQDL